MWNLQHNYLEDVKKVLFGPYALQNYSYSEIVANLYRYVSINSILNK